MPIGVVACIVRDKIPNYLSNVPIPRSLRGFFDLTLDEWIQLVSFSAICGGVLYVTAYPLYVVYYPEILKEFHQITKIEKSKRRKVSKLEELDIEDLGNRTKFCRCWKSKSFPFCDGCYTCSVFTQTPLVIVRRNQATPSHRNSQDPHPIRKCDSRNVLPKIDACCGSSTKKYHWFHTDHTDSSDISLTSFVTPNDNFSVNSVDLNHAIKYRENQEPELRVNFIQLEKESLKRESQSNTTFVVGKQSVTANRFAYETPPTEAQTNYKYPFSGFDLNTIPEMVYSMDLEARADQTPFVDFGTKNDPTSTCSMQTINYLESQEDPFADFDLVFKGSKTTSSEHLVTNSNEHPKPGENEHSRVSSSRLGKMQKKFNINSELSGKIKSSRRANAAQRPTSEYSKKVGAGENVRVEKKPVNDKTKCLFNSKVLMEPENMFSEYMKVVDDNADDPRYRKYSTVPRADEEFKKVKSFSSLFVQCDRLPSSSTTAEPNVEMAGDRYSNRTSENSSVCNMDGGMKLDEIVPSSLFLNSDSFSLTSRTEKLNSDASEEKMDRLINIVRGNVRVGEVENVLPEDNNETDAKRYLKYLRLVVLVTAKLPSDYDDD